MQIRIENLKMKLYKILLTTETLYFTSSTAAVLLNNPIIFLAGFFGALLLGIYLVEKT